MWQVGVGGIYGCGYWVGCKEVYRFPHTTYPVSVLFYSSIPTFCLLKKNFFVLVPVLFLYYILCF